jgi:anti-sigma factor RsiW
MYKLVIGGELYSADEEHPDEGLIMAYVDGELDEPDRRFVENLLLQSAEAREIAEMMRSSLALLKSAFLDVPEPSAIQPSIKHTRLSHPAKSAVSLRNCVQRKA